MKRLIWIVPLWIALCVEPGFCDVAQFGTAWSRNMVSEEDGFNFAFEPEGGETVAWRVELGTSYCTPVVSGGKVLIGCNNDKAKDPRHKGDRGVVLCLDEKTGNLLWQLVVPKLEGDIFLDWPKAGICSSPTVEGDRAYIMSNRVEVICVDMNGMADGNDGPFQDEGAFMAPDGEPAMDVGVLDADILWVFDLKSGAGVYPHDSTHASILIHGDQLYVNSCNGVDNTHAVIRKPDAPGIVVLDKQTGRMLARDYERTAPDTFHSNWSSPALGTVNDRTLVYYAAGNGILFGMRPIEGVREELQRMEVVWRRDLDPQAPKEDIHSYLRNRKESPSNVMSMPVFHEDRLYLTFGGDIWWGKREAWLKCYSADGEGDVTAEGALWSYPLREHTCSTPAISDGLIYAADCDGWLHCVDVATGQGVWTHDCEGEIWASPMVVEGRVVIGTRRGDLWILAAGREKAVESRIDCDSPISATLVPTGGTLYVATQSELLAIR